MSDEKILSAPRSTLADLELLRTFEPVVRFTKGEQFYPTDVERYVSQASLWARYPDGREERLVQTGGDSISTAWSSRGNIPSAP